MGMGSADCFLFVCLVLWSLLSPPTLTTVNTKTTLFDELWVIICSRYSRSRIPIPCEKLSGKLVLVVYIGSVYKAFPFYGVKRIWRMCSVGMFEELILSRDPELRSWNSGNCCQQAQGHLPNHRGKSIRLAPKVRRSKYSYVHLLQGLISSKSETLLVCICREV